MSTVQHLLFIFFDATKFRKISQRIIHITYCTHFCTVNNYPLDLSHAGIREKTQILQNNKIYRQKLENKPKVLKLSLAENIFCVK